MTNYPDIDPSDVGNFSGILKYIFGKLQSQVDGMLPARIVAYDRAKNRATVQPLIKNLTTSGFVASRSQLASIPVMQFGGGGFVFNFPFKAGDLGWIKASDRDISVFLQSFEEAQPNTLRTYSFSDGVFIPDAMKGWTIAGEDTDNAVIQTLDGSVRISIGANGVKITSPLITFDGDTVMNGDLNVHGTITAQNYLTEVI